MPKIQMYSTNETKETFCIVYSGFLFPHEYPGEDRSAYDLRLCV